MSSTTYRERMALREKVERSAKMATTYLRKAGGALHWSTDRPISVSYWTLLEQALQTALDIVEELPDDFFVSSEVEDYFGIGDALDLGAHNSSDEPLEAARKLLAAIEARRERGNVMRRIVAMENTTGRTEIEAAAFREKARELRKAHGLDAA